MRASFLLTLVAEAWLTDVVTAASTHNLGYEQPIPPRVHRPLDKRADAVTAATFQQLIDHRRPELGTFSQRYWYNDEFYDGPGSPVILVTPGESDAENYLGYTENEALPGKFGETNHAAVILLEHRFWGGSFPVSNLSTTNLQTHTLENAIQDLIYFANNVQLPFDLKGLSSPSKAPWVLTGCSYPGALAAWTQAKAPGTFWAYHASSAPVQAISANWDYFGPVEKAMPRNCSADYKTIITHVDSILVNGTAADKQALKTSFGLSDLPHDDDFASALIWPLIEWQNQLFTTGYSTLFRMCDYIEVIPYGLCLGAFAVRY